MSHTLENNSAADGVANLNISAPCAVKKVNTHSRSPFYEFSARWLWLCKCFFCTVCGTTSSLFYTCAVCVCAEARALDAAAYIKNKFTRPSAPLARNNYATFSVRIALDCTHSHTKTASMLRGVFYVITLLFPLSRWLRRVLYFLEGNWARAL